MWKKMRKLQKRPEQNCRAADQHLDGNHYTDSRRVPLMRKKPRFSVSAPRCYSHHLRFWRWQPSGRRLDFSCLQANHSHALDEFSESLLCAQCRSFLSPS
jgi:hypothetical protein